MIAMALVHNPDVLIADEPTTALDVTVQAQILELIDKVKKEFDVGVILITHDLGVVAETATHVMVMYAGRAMEYGDAAEIFDGAQHPYTWGLLESMPSIERKLDVLVPIEGSPPSLLQPAVGLRLPSALQVPLRAVPDEAAAARGDARRSSRRVPAPGRAQARGLADEGRRRDRSAGMSSCDDRSPSSRSTHLTKHFPVKQGVFARRQEPSSTRSRTST